MRIRMTLALILALMFAAPGAGADYYGVCTADGSLNVRSGAGMEYERLGTIPSGGYVLVTSEADGWLEIEYEGLRGWVSGKHVSAVSAEDEADMRILAMADRWASAAIGEAVKDKTSERVEFYAIRDGKFQIMENGALKWISKSGWRTAFYDSLDIGEGFSYQPITDDVKSRINGLSYKEDCTVPYEELRLIKVRYVDFEGAQQTGEIIANCAVAKELAVIFRALYEAKYPLTEVSLVDKYGADDKTSMSNNNTSAFNFRFMANGKLSKHGLGLAIDVNPLLNPYVYGSYFSPPNAEDYLDRERDFAGKIDKNDLCYKLFIQFDWQWGGAWKHEKDYQHFYKDL